MTSNIDNTPDTIPTAFDNDGAPQNTQTQHAYAGQAGDGTRGVYYTPDAQRQPAYVQAPYPGSLPGAPGTSGIPGDDGGKRPWSHGKLVGVVAVVSLLCGLTGGVGGAFAVHAITGTQSGGTTSGQMGQPPSGGQAPNGQSLNGQSSNGSGSSGSDSSGSGSSSSGSSDSSSSN